MFNYFLETNKAMINSYFYVSKLATNTDWIESLLKQRLKGYMYGST